MEALFALIHSQSYLHSKRLHFLSFQFQTLRSVYCEKHYRMQH